LIGADQLSQAPHRHRRLERADQHAPADQVLRLVDPGRGIGEDVVLAEQAARKHRDADKRCAAAGRDDVRGQRRFSDVELIVAQEALMPGDAVATRVRHADFQHPQGKPGGGMTEPKNSGTWRS
jgi:hypothetical protein